MLLGLTAALAAAALFGAVAVVQALAIRQRGLISWPMLGVLLGYVAGWALHLIAIAELPLYLAQVGVGASLVVTTLIAALVLEEPLRLEHWIAVATMVAGLGALAIASDSLGDSEFTPRTTLSLYVVLVVTSALGWLAWRWQHPSSGVALAILGGVAYGGSPIATRALIDFAWDLNTLATAISIGLFGTLGFLLYSVALKRTSVTAATAPLILLQTAIPAVVGIALFGDQVRSGWWPIAAVAFVASVAASLVLCGAEAQIELHEEADADPVPAVSQDAVDG